MLEDVSRLHCSIVFDKENHATLHIYGANGVWHNHSLLKPQDRNTCVSLADGDQLKISKHLLRFAYGTPYEEKEEGMVSQAEDIQDTTCVPGEDNVPSPSSSYLENDVTPTPTQDEAEQDPELPACTAPLGEQLGNLSVSQTSATTDSHEGHGTAQTNLIPEKTYNEPAPSATSTPRRARRASHLTTTIPRRQSARLKARASLPSMRSAWTPEHAKRPVLVSQHVDIPEKDTTSISTVDGTQNLSASLPQEESMTSSSIAVQESDKARDPTLEDMDQKSMSMEMDGGNTLTPSIDGSTETLCLNTAEESLVDAELQAVPSLPSSPFSPRNSSVLSPRVPHSRPLSGMMMSTPLVWSPSKSRKVSLRTATLLKRSAQYPILPMDVPRDRQSSASMLDSSPHTQASMGSKDMDLNSSSYLAYDESDAPSSDDEEEAEVEKSLELSTEVGTTPSPKPKPLGPHFLTPQADKPTKVETRRLSDIQATKENDKRTPMPCHRSSWQWLRNMLSPSSLSAESEAESKAEDMEAREYPSMMDTSDVVPEGENTRDDEETDKTPKVAEPEEVAEEVAEEPVSNTSIEAGRSTLAVECLQEKKPEPPTPDMRVLKHMFSEPRPVAGVDTALSDFRHLVYAQERTMAPLPDLSLAQAWTTLEVDKPPSTLVSAETETVQSDQAPPVIEDADAPNDTRISAAPTLAPAPTQPNVERRRSSRLSEPRRRSIISLTSAPLDSTSSQSAHLQDLNPVRAPLTNLKSVTNVAASASNVDSDMALRRSTRIVTKKEPYVPVRRQIVPRNNMKLPRIGTLPSNMTRGTSTDAASADLSAKTTPTTGVAGRLPTASSRLPTSTSAAPRARTLNVSSIPLSKTTTTSSSQTRTAQSLKKEPSRTMRAQTDRSMPLPPGGQPK